jgi:hypothetical protein
MDKAAHTVTTSVDTSQASDNESIHVNGVDRDIVTPDGDAFWDPARLGLRQDFELEAGVKRVLTVPVRKPGKQTFFRVHSDPAYRLTALLFEWKQDRENFLVDPTLIEYLSEDATPVVLYTSIDRQDNLFIWPAKLSAPDGRIVEWYTSAHSIAELAMAKWVRMQANLDSGCYEAFEASAKLPAPRWPNVTFNEILKAAFKDRIILDLDHPAIKKLRGEI